jgi:hypothetical protein
MQLGVCAKELSSEFDKATERLGDTPWDIWRLSLLETDKVRWIFVSLPAPSRRSVSLFVLSSSKYLLSHSFLSYSFSFSSAFSSSSSSSSASFSSFSPFSSVPPFAPHLPPPFPSPPPHPPQSRLERAGVFLMATTMQRPETTDHKIIYASSWVKAITGYEMAEFLGKDCRFLQGPDTDMAQCYKIRQVRRDRA